MRKFWGCLWRSIEEPRTATLLAIGMYLAAGVMGAGLLINPPLHPQSSPDSVLLWFVAAALLSSGLLGPVTAWRGWWWMERLAASMAVTGMVVTLFKIAAVAWPGPPDMRLPWLTIPAVLLGLLALWKRLVHVRRQPFAPGKGPDLPEVEADHLLAQMISDDSDSEGVRSPPRE